MIEQLEESLRFDCFDTSVTPSPKQKQQTPEEHLQERIARARYDLEFREQSWAEEVKRTNERNAWNKALVESLKVQP